MRRLFLIFAWCSALLIAGCGQLIPAHHQTTAPAELPKGNFRLDPDHTTILFRADHLGFSTYVGRFNSTEGSLTFDAEAPAQSALEVRIQVASIDTPSDELDAMLRGPDWFDAQRFPTARFVARKITAASATQGTIEGDLTLHGETRPVSLAATFHGGGTNAITGKYTLGFSAETTIKRSDFGITNLVPAVGDQVALEIHAEFQKLDADE